MGGQPLRFSCYEPYDIGIIISFLFDRPTAHSRHVLLSRRHERQTLFLGDVLDMLEHRHEWANFHFTWTHFRFVLTKMLPVVASHSKSADEAEINSQYDREFVISRHPV